MIVVFASAQNRLGFMKYLWWLLIAVLVLLTAKLQTCTTFCMKDGEQVTLGRNYDWGIGIGMLMANKRDVSKTAMFQKDERPAKWISKYGSLTFNQYGREFPQS